MSTFVFAYVCIYNATMIRFAEYVKQIKIVNTLSLIYFYITVYCFDTRYAFFKCSSWDNRPYVKLDNLATK